MQGCLSRFFCPAPTLKYVIFMGRQGYLNFD